MLLSTCICLTVVTVFHREIEHIAFAKMKLKVVLSPDDEEAQGAALYFMSFQILYLQVLLFLVLNVVLNRTSYGDPELADPHFLPNANNEIHRQ
jgi:hypothetical protein